MNTETQRQRVFYYLWSFQTLCLCVSVFYFVAKLIAPPETLLLAVGQGLHDLCFEFLAEFGVVAEELLGGVAALA